jgi:hypothetical protein
MGDVLQDTSLGRILMIDTVDPGLNQCSTLDGGEQHPAQAISHGVAKPLLEGLDDELPVASAAGISFALDSVR